MKLFSGTLQQGYALGYLMAAGQMLAWYQLLDKAERLSAS